MRSLVIVSLSLVATIAGAETIKPAFQLVEDTAMGTQLQPDKPLLSDKATPAITTCLAATQGSNEASNETSNEASNGALFWLEISRAGAVTAARVRGSGKLALDTCLAAALRKATTQKLTAPIVLVGHIDLKRREANAFVPAPRQSTTAVLIPPHAAKWQVMVNHLAYTANRAADIAAAVDGTSMAIAACAPKRGKTAAAAEAMVWYDGKAIVRSGTPAYDTCVAKAFGTIKLPDADSSMWMKLAITAPSEPLAPMTDKAALSRDQGLKDALTTAVRSRKDILLGCLDGHPKAKLAKLTLELRATKVNVKSVSTGVADADACVRKKLANVAIPNAKPDDKLDLEVSLERE